MAGARGLRAPERTTSSDLNADDANDSKGDDGENLE